MKLSIVLAAGVLVANVIALQSSTASAQSDRTLGINCTVAGHEHCGEAGPIGASSHRWRHHYGAYAYARDCRMMKQRIETPSGRLIYRSKRICR